MDMERYSKLMDEAKDTRFNLVVDRVGVGILSSALRLLILHPQTQQFGPTFKASATELRGWCRQQFLSMGFTEEDIKELDPDK
jgi:hypothetical protein